MVNSIPPLPLYPITPLPLYAITHNPMHQSSSAAQEFLRLVEIMATLRSTDGCPWDREQTIDSLKPFVLEETYEVLEAIDRHDHPALREELGDFRFMEVFLAQLEAGKGTQFDPIIVDYFLQMMRPRLAENSEDHHASPAVG